MICRFILLMKVGCPVSNAARVKPLCLFGLQPLLFWCLASHSTLLLCFFLSNVNGIKVSLFIRNQNKSHSLALCFWEELELLTLRHPGAGTIAADATCASKAATFFFCFVYFVVARKPHASADIQFNRSQWCCWSSSWSTVARIGPDNAYASAFVFSPSIVCLCFAFSSLGWWISVYAAEDDESAFGSGMFQSAKVDLFLVIVGCISNLDCNFKIVLFFFCSSWCISSSLLLYNAIYHICRQPVYNCCLANTMTATSVECHTHSAKEDVA